MRSLVLATALSLSFVAPALHAEPDDADVMTLEEELEERQYGWNQWVCTAYTPGYFRPFVGISYYFREGSGEGQRARSIAQLNAIRQCEFQTGRRCYSRIDRDCYVQRY